MKVSSFKEQNVSKCNNSGSFALLLSLHFENLLSLIISKTIKKLKNFFKHVLYIPLRSTNICFLRKYSASYARDSHINVCSLQCTLLQSHLDQMWCCVYRASYCNVLMCVPCIILQCFNVTLCVPCIILQCVNDQRDAQFL